MSEPKVFIIILQYNNWTDTQECLESVKKINYSNYEVVLVDNNSLDKPKVTDNEVKVIMSSENLGFSGGNNLGINYALSQKADYVLLLNNDTTVDKEFLGEMVKVAENDQLIGLVGPKIYMAAQPQQIWYAGGQVNWLYTRGTMRGYNEKDEGQYDQPLVQKTDYVTGCCLLIKGEVVNKIGLMTEEYFLYYEDTDWSLKAQKAGFKCVFAPRATIWHKGSKSAKEGSDSFIYYHARNGLMLAQRYAPWYTIIFVHLDAKWRLGKQIFKFIFISEKRKWAKSIMRGIKDFYLGRSGKI